MPARAFCINCGTFTVIKATDKCLTCGTERHEKYEFVHTDEKKHHTEEKPLEVNQNQLGLGI